MSCGRRLGELDALLWIRSARVLGRYDIPSGGANSENRVAQSRFIPGNRREHPHAPVRTTNGVINDIDAFRVQTAQCLPQVIVLIVDRHICPAIAAESQLGLTGRARDHCGADCLPDVNGRHADPAGRAEHQQRLAALELCDIDQGVVCRT